MTFFGIAVKPSAATLAGASRSSNMLFEPHGRGEKGDQGLLHEREREREREMFL